MRYWPPAASRTVRPSGTEARNARKAPETSVRPVASIEVGTRTTGAAAGAAAGGWASGRGRRGGWAGG